MKRSGHPIKLLEMIRDQVASTYPLNAYRFTFEETLKWRQLRFQPDIVVRDAGGRIICLVEIGYTRPEKLTHYRRALNVGDVRWYDKTGKLHGDVEEKVIVTRKHVQYSLPPELSFYTLPLSGVVCRDCYGDADELADDDDFDLALTEATVAVDAYLLFNRKRWLVVYGCDACGNYGTHNEADVITYCNTLCEQDFDSLYAASARIRRETAGAPLDLSGCGMLHIEIRKWQYDELILRLAEFGLVIDYSMFAKHGQPYIAGAV